MNRGEEHRPPASQGLYRRLTRNLIYLAGGTATAAIFMMLAAGFNARALSAQEFGLLALLQTSALMLRGLISFGTQQPVIQLGAAALADHDEARLGQVIGLCLGLDLVAAVAATILAFLVIFLAGGWIGLRSSDTAWACIFAAGLLFTGYLTSNGIFRLLNRFDLLSLIQAGSGAAILAVAIWFWYVGADFETYVWAWAGFMALSTQVQLWTSLWLIRRSGVAISFRFRRTGPDDTRKVMEFCWSTWGNAAIDAVRVHGDSLLVGLFVGIEAAGVYAVAKQLTGIVRKATDIYASAAYPEVAMLAAERDFDGARSLRNWMIVAGAVVGLLGLAATAVVGRPLLGFVFGPVFTTGYGALVLLIAAAGLQLISHPLAVFVQVFLSPARLFAIYASALLLYALAAPFGIFWLGITGAAFGQLIFTAAVIALSTVALRRTFTPAPPG